MGNIAVNAGGTGTAYRAAPGGVSIFGANRGMQTASVFVRSGQKSTGTKKRLNYNYREVSSQLLRAKKVQGAANALTRARQKLSSLLRSAASGDYDSRELANATAHARKMVECARLKLNHLKEEAAAQRLPKTCGEKERWKELYRKRSRHRREEQAKINDADMKYLKRQMKNNGYNGAGMAQANVILNLSAEAAYLREVQIKVQVEQEAGAGLDETAVIPDASAPSAAYMGAASPQEGAAGAVLNFTV